ITWRRAPGGLVYQEVRAEFKGLDVSLDRSKVFALGAAGEAHHFIAGQGWLRAERADDSNLLARSSHWRCRRLPDGSKALEVQQGEQWLTLPLSESGDFAYRRPSGIALAGDRSFWSLSPDLLVRSEENHGALLSVELLRPQDIDPAVSSRFQELLTLDEKPHLLLGGAGYSHADGRWKPADLNGRQQVRQLWTGNPWTWNGVPAGPPEIVHTTNDGASLSLQWNQETGRFDVDHATDAAIWKNALWLATPDRVIRVQAGDRQTAQVLEPTQQAAERMFALRRSSSLDLLVANDASGLAAAKVNFDGEEAAVATGVDASAARQAFQAMYQDTDWQFVRGSQPRLQWRGFESGIRNGRLLHDEFLSMTVVEDALWAATPIALMRFGLGASSLILNDVLPLPSGSQRVEAVSAAQDCPAVVNERGESFVWNDAQREWRHREETQSGESRLLVDNDVWRWERTPEATLRVTLKQADQTTLQPVLTTEGRFLFDDVTAVATDVDVAWFGGREGITCCNPLEGTIRYWYRMGETAEGNVALGPVLVMGRFTETGDPLPSSASAKARTTSRLLALDAKGRTWRHTVGNPGGWQLSDSNPWQAPGGRWAMRTPSLEAFITDDGNVALSYPRSNALTDGDTSTHAPAILLDGRLQSDVVLGAVFHHGAGYLATPAGMVETDREGNYQRMWFASSEVGGRTRDGPARLFVHADSGQLYTVDSAGSLFRFQASEDAWKSETIDEPFRETADVLVKDEFWTWSRWGDEVSVQIHKADASGDNWPLFADGRFSFDVLRNFRMQREHLWATTAGGVVQFRRDDMNVVSIYRRATAIETGDGVALVGERFSPEDRLVCYDDQYRYEYGEDGWRRRRDDAYVTQANIGYADGRRRWKVAPLESGDAASGFYVELYEEGRGKLDEFEVLHDVSHDRLRRVVAADGRLWICLDHGLYQITPR
ncbi:MAG: hypothetical protein ACC628_18840, partial [Pirellulaceae bacterium]